MKLFCLQIAIFLMNVITHINEFIKHSFSTYYLPLDKTSNNILFILPQTPPGVDIVNSWPPSGMSWLRNSRTRLTSSSLRWIPQLMK